MSDFKVEVVRIDEILLHENADRLEIAKVGGFVSIVLKDQFQTGDKAVYIPEASIVPDELLKELHLWDDTREPEKGKLAGKQGNRVKPIRLRGIFSEGICMHPIEDVPIGTNVADYYGITKYEPPIPQQFQGQRQGGPFPLSYDIENIKKRCHLMEGELVAYTEKIHGTFMAVGIPPESERKEGMLEGKYIVSSKGLIKQGIYLKDVPENDFNVYLRLAKQMDIGYRFRSAFGTPESGVSWLLGEVYGVQKGYKYGAEKEDTLGFRVFDIKIDNEYLSWHRVVQLSKQMGLTTVPELDRNNFNPENLEKHTNGRETISGSEKHIREGVVVRPLTERRDNLGRRIMYKSVSESYLLKTDGSEFN